MSHQKSEYINGHHESVLRSHSWRTAANSAAYMLNLIKPDMHILDIGCGPGSITVDFGTLVPQGKVIGIENTEDPLPQARKFAAIRGVTNVEFAVGSAYNLDYPDATFNIVHTHQVLQHLSDPVKALQEMRRVTKPGGFVATREGEVSSMIYFPENSAFDDFKRVHVTIARSLGVEPNAARRLLSWALKAGFDRASATATASAWCYSTPEERVWWGNTWADRIALSSFHRQALDGGYATQEDIDRMASAFREWVNQEDGWFAMMHGELVCRV